MSKSVLVVDDFAPQARDLRAAFDARFADPRKAGSDRFVWDYWHVPGQYTVLRTPAYVYFPPKAYAAFHRRLVAWGRENLGCHDVSPPWLSCYVEGCRQELHGDLPHGPYAFVWSLTRWSKRVFSGGETLLVRDEILDYWRGFTSTRSLEEPGILREIPAKWNRLVVFDPRVPHGVRRVTGTHDPREGRLVVHGWFVSPRPFFEGPLPRRAVAAAIDEISSAVAPFVEAGLPVAGALTLRFEVTPSGAPRAIRALADTTRTAAELEPERRRLVRAVLDRAAKLRYPRARGATRVTIPLVFERG